VTKAFDSAKALDALSFQIPENKIVGLIGANGAGKTTSLRLIIRYLIPDAGNIYYRDREIRALPDTAFPISYIPDSPIFFEELSAKEHLAFISAMYRTESRVEELVSLFEMERHLDKVPSVLSKGTRQKLMIMCALLRDYETLVADEPFAGLDPRQAKVLKDVFMEQREKGKTVILSTHLLDMAESLCDFCVMIGDGKLLWQGMINDAPSGGKHSSLEDLYLWLAQTGGYGSDSNGSDGSDSNGSDSGMGRISNLQAQSRNE
jgi:ABC-2 type transport system ATP-binding protein